jgi:hypothetical protein
MLTDIYLLRLQYICAIHLLNIFIISLLPYPKKQHILFGSTDNFSHLFGINTSTANSKKNNLIVADFYRSSVFALLV